MSRGSRARDLNAVAQLRLQALPAAQFDYLLGVVILNDVVIVFVEQAAGPRDRAAFGLRRKFHRAAGGNRGKQRSIGARYARYSDQRGHMYSSHVDARREIDAQPAVGMNLQVRRVDLKRRRRAYETSAFLNYHTIRQQTRARILGQLQFRAVS